ncbi:MAG TPA: hypothetical protein VFB33_07970 [Candidatus Binataceae bacterium]|nr:hypothetical protein [Candidatus Binataceae bacterium]
MKRKIARAAAAALIAVALVLSACHRGTPGATDYFPLEQGMTWMLRYRASTGASGRLTATNLAPRKLLGVMAVGQRNTGGGEKTFTEYYAAQPEGIRYVARESPDGLEPHLDDNSWVIKYPIKVGTIWREVDRTLDGTVFFAKTMIESVSDKITVPAGTFTACVRVRETGIASPLKGVADFRPAAGGVAPAATRAIRVEDYYWMAPGVGVIKGKHRESVGEGPMERAVEIDLELMSFRH